MVTFDTRKATALLGYLAVTARPQRRETLAALLWPDADETRARSALRRTLSVVRKELGDLGPSITREEVELVDGDGRRDRRAGVPRRRGVGRRRARSRSAAALWRGDLLAGFSLRDSPDFDDWQAREAERLRRVMSSALRSARRCRCGRRRAGRRPSPTPSDGWTSTRSTSRPTAR